MAKQKCPPGMRVKRRKGKPPICVLKAQLTKREANWLLARFPLRKSDLMKLVKGNGRKKGKR